MLWIILREVVTLALWPSASRLWRSGRQRTFDGLLVGGGWLLVAFFLAVSLPHSVEILLLYEHGGDGWAFPKAVLMAGAIELVPAFTFMIGLHNHTLSEGRRVSLMAASVPFIALVLHIQVSYYFDPHAIRIWAIELAAVLPVGILVGTVAIAFLSASFQTAQQTLARRLEEVRREVEETLEARYREIFEEQERVYQAEAGAGAGAGAEIGSLVKPVSVTRDLLDGPQMQPPAQEDARWIALQNELEARDHTLELTREELASTRQKLEASGEELASTRQKLEARLETPLLQPDEIIMSRTERVGLEEHIRTLETALKTACTRVTFPKEAVADIFRRLNPRAADRLDQAGAKVLLELLWTNAAGSGTGTSSGTGTTSDNSSSSSNNISSSSSSHSDTDWNRIEVTKATQEGREGAVGAASATQVAEVANSKVTARAISSPTTTSTE